MIKFVLKHKGWLKPWHSTVCALICPHRSLRCVRLLFLNILNILFLPNCKYKILDHRRKGCERKWWRFVSVLSSVELFMNDKETKGNMREEDYVNLHAVLLPASLKRRHYSTSLCQLQSWTFHISNLWLLSAPHKQLNPSQSSLLSNGSNPQTLNTHSQNSTVAQSAETNSACDCADYTLVCIISRLKGQKGKFWRYIMSVL